MRNIYLDYNSISLRLEQLASEFEEKDFDAVVMVLRGGSFPGMHLTFLTGLPFHFLTYDREHQEVKWHGPAPAADNILLVEDFAGLGRTLIDCKGFLIRNDYHVTTLVICKDTKSASAPDYFCFSTEEQDARFILPWERYRLNRDSDEVTKKDHEFERILMDAQLTIKSMEPHGYLQYKNDFLLIYTGDKEILYSSEIKKMGEGPKWTAIVKGAAAIKLGCTHLVLENAEEAVHIASLYPELRVMWWSDGEKVHVQSAGERQERLTRI